MSTGPIPRKLPYPSLSPSPSDSQSKGHRVGGAGPRNSGGATDAATGRGEGKPPIKQTKSQEGEEEPTSLKNSERDKSHDGKNLKKKYSNTYLSNPTTTEKEDPVLSLDSLAKARSTKEVKGSLLPPNKYLPSTTYLPDPCPTPDATPTEKELWRHEMAELRPYLEEKNSSAPAANSGIE
jgi:hypothetical protein